MAADASTLTRRIAAGDTEAFACFYEMWFDVVYGQARKITRRDEQFCLDIVQDVMMRVIRSMKPMDTEAAVRRWLYVVTRSCAYDVFRREGRERARCTSTMQADVAVNAAPAFEQTAWLEAELRALPAEERQLVLMRYRFGWTMQAISDHAGVALSTVHRRLERIVSGLRQRARTDAVSEVADE